MTPLQAFQEMEWETSHNSNIPTFTLIADVLLVRELPQAEVKTQSGLILSTATGRQVDGIEANRPCWVEVLKIGEGFYGEDGDVPLDAKPGMIALVPKLSVKWISMFGPIASTPENNLGLVRESEIQCRFDSLADHDAYMKTLQEKLLFNAGQASHS